MTTVIPKDGETPRKRYDHTKEMIKLHAELDRMKSALKFIGSHKCCDEVRDLDKMARSWGLERGEFVEMAHDNLVVAARNALKRPKKPRAVDLPGKPRVSETVCDT